MLIKDEAAATLLEDQLAVVVQALEAFRARLTIEEHVHLIRAAANASAALGDGDPLRIKRCLCEMDDAAAVLAFAVRRRATSPPSASRSLRPR